MQFSNNNTIRKKGQNRETQQTLLKCEFCIWWICGKTELKYFISKTATSGRQLLFNMVFKLKLLSSNLYMLVLIVTPIKRIWISEQNVFVPLSEQTCFSVFKKTIFNIIEEAGWWNVELQNNTSCHHSKLTIHFKRNHDIYLVVDISRYNSVHCKNFRQL